MKCTRRGRQCPLDGRSISPDSGPPASMQQCPLVRDGRVTSQDPPPRVRLFGGVPTAGGRSASRWLRFAPADEAKSEMPNSAQQGQEVFDLFDQIGWPLSNSTGGPG